MSEYLSPLPHQQIPQFLQPDYKMSDNPSQEAGIKAATEFRHTVTETMFSLGRPDIDSSDVEAEFTVSLAGGKEVRGAVGRYGYPELYSPDATDKSLTYARYVSLELPQSDGNPPRSVKLWSSTKGRVALQHDEGTRAVTSDEVQELTTFLQDAVPDRRRGALGRFVGWTAAATAVAGVTFFAGLTAANHAIDQHKEGERITEAHQEQVQEAIDGPIKVATNDILAHDPRELESAAGYTYFTGVDPEDHSFALRLWANPDDESKHKSITIRYEVAAGSQILADAEPTVAEVRAAVADKDTHATFVELLDSHEKITHAAFLAPEGSRHEFSTNDDGFLRSEDGEAGVSFDFTPGVDAGKSSEEFREALTLADEKARDLAKDVTEVAEGILGPHDQ